MANAEQSAQPANPFSLDLLGRLTVRQMVVLMVAISMVIAVLTGAWLWLKESDYSVLFSNLSDKDGGEIIAALQQQNVPYKYDAGGSVILVPSAMVHDSRLRLASQGLPKGGIVGFELLENQKMGASQFLEQVNYQRGLEGELAKTISTLSSVRGARVHLAIPKQSAFLRDEQKPTASVVLGLQPGRALDAGQVAGIVHLVSSSVPELAPASVSVIDQDGNLLSQSNNESARDTGLDATQLRYVREIEASYNRRIEAILSPIVGVGNVHAQVTADVDFSQADQVAESYKPNPPPQTAIRSQQSSETSSGSPSPSGVPGALTNQPAPAATAPLTAGAAPASTTSTNSASTQNVTRSSTINYEVDKTIRHTKEMPGMIRHLSVAVVVNQKSDASKGPTAKPVPLSDKELAQVTALAREAMGFNKERGDSLNVTNALFSTGALDGTVADTPLWKDAGLIGSAKGVLKYVIFGVIAFLLWTRLLKPLFANLAAVAQASKIDRGNMPLIVDDGGSQITPASIRAGGFESKMKTAQQMASNDPKLVASLIKEWVGGSGSR